MGNRITDRIIDQQISSNRQYLKKQATNILNTKPFGSDFTDIEWMFENKNKIIRNRKLIELLG